MSVDREQTNARGVDTGNNQVRANVALVAEEVLLQHGHAGDDSRGPARREGVQFDVGANQGGGEFCVSGGSGSRTPDLGGDVV